jgi:FKBP-type peptidyl-prolyl cis-trans isomerase SlpA
LSSSFWVERGEKKRFRWSRTRHLARRPDLIQYFSRREFIDAGEPEIGAIMLFTAMDGSEMPGVIREVNGDSITVDFNHPLAGRPFILMLKCWKSIRRWRMHADPVG